MCLTDLTQCRSDVSVGKKRDRKRGEGNECRRQSNMASAVSWPFYLSRIKKKKKTFSAHTNTHSQTVVFVLSLFHTARAYHFSFSTNCDLLNNVFFVINGHDVICRIWTPLRASNLLQSFFYVHCQAHSSIRNQTIFCSGICS